MNFMKINCNNMGATNTPNNCKPPPGGKLIYYRCSSMSPPHVRKSDDGSSKSIQRQHSLIIKRQDKLPRSGVTNAVTPIPNVAESIRPNPTGTNIVQTIQADSLRDKSIRRISLTPQTNGIAIVIGQNKSGPTNRLDSTRLNNDSSLQQRQHQPIQSSYAVPVSPLRQTSGPGLFDLGIAIDNHSLSRPCTTTNYSSNDAVSNGLSCVESSVQSSGPEPRKVRIALGRSASVSFGRSSDNFVSLRGNFQKARINNPNSTTTTQHSSEPGHQFFVTLPPLPNTESEHNSSGVGKTSIRISSTKGQIVVSTNNPAGVRFIKSPPKPHTPLFSLRPTSSYDNLFTNRDRFEDLHPQIRLENRSQTPVYYHRILRTDNQATASKVPPLVDRPVNEMPNATSMGMEDIKPNCSTQASPLAHPVMSGQASPDVRPHRVVGGGCSDSVERSRFTSDDNFTPGLPLGPRKYNGSNMMTNKTRNNRSSVTGNTNHSQYFRIQIPSTRAISRPKGFAMTDSLKLYEEQIFSHCAPNQRPQSWCTDYMQPDVPEQGAGLDDSHSSSPASTVSSSFSSSSSSEASHMPPKVYTHRVGPLKLQKDNCTAALPPQSRAFPWTSQAGQPSPPNQTTNDAITPTSPFPPAQFIPQNILPPTPLHSSDLTKPTYQQIPTSVPNNTNGTCNSASSASSTSTGRTRLLNLNPATSSTGNSSGNSGFHSGFDTVRPINVSPAQLHTQLSSMQLSQSRDRLGSDSILTGDPTMPHVEDSNTKSKSDPNSPESCLSHSEQGSPLHLPSPKLPPSPGDPVLVSEMPFRSPDDLEDPPNSGSSIVVPPPIPWNYDTPSDDKLETTPSLFQSQSNDIQATNSQNDILAHLAYHPGLAGPAIHSSGCCLDNLSTNESVFSDPISDSFSLSKDDDLDMDSLGMSSLTDDGNTYAFSSLDSDYLAWMRLSVRDVTNMPDTDGRQNKLRQLTDLDSLSRAQVHYWVDLFNSNPLGLRLNFVDDSCRLAGTLRIYINLIKPVKMSLRRTMDMLPPSTSQDPANKDSEQNGENAQNDLPSPARLVSFFLPRGTSKVVYITSSTTSANAIQSLLDRFHIQESSRKFALYEHTLENNTIVARKLSTTECPLLVLLNWVRITPSRDKFIELLNQKRIVLQENDACDIDWKDFTAAELANFLRILDKEESEYRNAILYQYGLLRNQLEQRMQQLALMGMTNSTTHHPHHHNHSEHRSPTYSRYHPDVHPFDTPQDPPTPKGPRRDLSNPSNLSAIHSPASSV